MGLRSEQIFYVRHLYANLKKIFGGGSLVRNLMMGNVVINNLNKSMSSVLLACRDKPILTMVDWIRKYLMCKFTISRLKLAKQ